MTTLYEKRSSGRYSQVGTLLIPPARQREALIYAFRYALGRRTYATLTMQETIKFAWPNLNDGTKALIKREIREAEQEDCLGDECDRRGWLKLLELPE